jgi:heparanase
MPMMTCRNIGASYDVCLSLAVLGAVCSRALADEMLITPASLHRIGTIDERFQSYNIEMLEVTGGRFWKPYGPELRAELTHRSQTPATSGTNSPAGMNPSLYAYRPPIDLTSTRLRALAAALAPAYVRVSGTWANTTYFADFDTAVSTPPGFNGTLTRTQWRGVVDFSQVVNARIVTSFAISPGTRDAAGVWKTDQASRLNAYTRSVGGSIAAAEFMNEPTLAAMGGAPAGYNAAAYGRDFRIFRAFVKHDIPDMLILGPGSVGETVEAWGLASGALPVLKTADLLAASGPGVDAFSYHHYGAASERCAGMGLAQTTAKAALSEKWLARTDNTLAFYRKLRDQFEPGKPVWVTETADAACGGNPWATTFLDTFRYLDQLGRLAKAGIQIVIHNTLASSDYGLLDDRTLAPRPNYWGALLWRPLMGTMVLESGVPIQKGLHVYAHCQRGVSGGVVLLVINNDRRASHSLKLPVASERYMLDAANLQDATVRLNGGVLALGANDELPRFGGAPTAAGSITFAPATITFLAVPTAGNAACQ